LWNIVDGLVLQLIDGTQFSVVDVSNETKKVWGGVPIVILPSSSKDYITVIEQNIINSTDLKLLVESNK